MTIEGGSDLNVAIERGEIYEHETHGRVEVLGIWRGVQRVDEAGNIDAADSPMVVCFAIRENDQPVGELSDTLESFLSAVESPD